MKLYWSLKNIPELSYLSAQQKQMLWQKSSTKIFRSWYGWLGLLACFLCTSFGNFVGQFFDVSSLGSAVGGGVGGFIYSQLNFNFLVKNYQHILVDKHALQQIGMQE